MCLKFLVQNLTPGEHLEQCMVVIVAGKKDVIPTVYGQMDGQIFLFSESSSTGFVPCQLHGLG